MIRRAFHLRVVFLDTLASTMTQTDLTPEQIVMLCICDYASQVRGKGFPLTELPIRQRQGMGLAPTNLMINALGQTPATPWGALGELLMMPDAGTKLEIPGDDHHPDAYLLLADLVQLDGTPWPNCPRHLLRRAIAALRDEFGLQVKAAFEHEFHFSGVDERVGDAYLAESVDSAGNFPATLLATMRHNGISPESFLPEFGPRQFEVTQAAALGMTAADQAVQVRELVRRLARRAGGRASFAPLIAPGEVGNGVHVHFSLVDINDEPISYDPANQHGISSRAGAFLAGVLRDIPDFVALTAASGISYDRLQPDRWSATYNNLGRLDREASVRLCEAPTIKDVDPTTATNFEYRAADVSGNPYLVLGALVWSGVQGLRDELSAPIVTTESPEQMSAARRQELGLVHLPGSLSEALDRLAGSARLREWLGSEFIDSYDMTKRGELGLLAELDEAERVARYVAGY